MPVLLAPTVPPTGISGGGKGAVEEQEKSFRVSGKKSHGVLTPVHTAHKHMFASGTDLHIASSEHGLYFGQDVLARVACFHHGAPRCAESCSWGKKKARELDEQREEGESEGRGRGEMANTVVPVEVWPSVWGLVVPPRCEPTAAELEALKVFRAVCKDWRRAMDQHCLKVVHSIQEPRSASTCVPLLPGDTSPPAGIAYRMAQDWVVLAVVSAARHSNDDEQRLPEMRQEFLTSPPMYVYRMVYDLIGIGAPGGSPMKCALRSDGPSVVRWQRIGATRPQHGRLLRNAGLSIALQSGTEFTRKQWDVFDCRLVHNEGMIDFLRHDDFICSGSYYFRPVTVMEEGDEFFMWPAPKTSTSTDCDRRRALFAKNRTAFATNVCKRIMHVLRSHADTQRDGGRRAPPSIESLIKKVELAITRPYFEI